MPTTQNTINLIRTKTSTAPQFDAIDTSLRKTGYIALFGVLALGIITGIIFTLFNMQLRSEEIEQSQLLTRINALKTKEGYLLAIKDRTKTVEKAMTNQKPWSQMLDLVSTFARPPALTRLSVDDQNKISLSLRTNSLEDILRIVDTIVNHVSTGKIKTPRLVSFALGKDGDFEISFTFFATFSEI